MWGRFHGPPPPVQRPPVAGPNIGAPSGDEVVVGEHVGSYGFSIRTVWATGAAVLTRGATPRPNW